MNEESRVVQTLRKRATMVALVFGVALVVLGAGLGVASVGGILSLGVGSSLIAASLYTSFAEFREGFAESLLEQGLVGLFSNRVREFDDVAWNDMIRGTRDHYRVLGVANHGYVRTQELKDSTHEALLGALRRGVTVEILWLNPEHTLADVREQEEGRTTRRDIVDSIRWFAELRDNLDGEMGQRLRLMEHEATPSCGLTWADDRLVVTHTSRASTTWVLRG